MMRRGAWLLWLVLFLAGFTPGPAADPPPDGTPPVQAEGPAPRDAEPAAPAMPPRNPRDHDGEAIAIMMLGVLLLFSGFAVLVLVVVLAPDVTAMLAAEVKGSFFKRFFVGVANVLFLLAVVKITRNVAGIVIVPFLVILLLLGLVVLSDEVGRRVQHASGAEWNRIRRMAAGWTTLYLAAWFPFVGWFLVAPVATFTAVGTVMLWLLTKRARPAAPPAPPAETAETP